MQNLRKNGKDLAGRSILFICTANANRSKTAEIWFSIRHPKYLYQSAGSCKAACRIRKGKYVSDEQLSASSRIICMENRNVNDIQKAYGHKYDYKIEVADIPDRYKYLELTLLFEIIDKIKL